jgi:hypothetical protein
MRMFLEYDATFSSCMQHEVCLDECCKGRSWRYTLVRRFPLCNFDRMLLVIALNPSTADKLDDDNTVTRLMYFARNWGFSELVVCNAFAWRSTNPKALLQVPDPVGPDNDRCIREQVARADQVVVAWGKPGRLHDRGKVVLDLLRSMNVAPWCFGKNKDGAPTHPLYQPNTAKLIPYGDQ